MEREEPQDYRLRTLCTVSTEESGLWVSLSDGDLVGFSGVVVRSNLYFEMATGFKVIGVGFQMIDDGVTTRERRIS